MSDATNWGPLLKRTFGNPVDPIPSDDTIASDIDFVPQEKKPGEKYTFPVRLQHEGGATYNVLHDAFTIGSAVDSLEKTAELEGSEIAVYGNIPTGMMTKMNASKGESGRAYDQAMGRKLVYLMEAAELRRELSLLYGSGTSGLSNLGVVELVITEAGTSLVVTVTRPSFIGGMWPQLIGLQFDFYSAAGVIANTTGACTLTAVNKTNTRLSFTCASADITAGLFAAGDQIFFRGSRAKSCIGLQAILENTGTLFGISAATYPQWKAEQYSVSGALTFDKVIEGLAGASENGADSGVNLYVSGRQWTDLMTDEAALVRRLKDDQKTYKRGAGSIEFESLVGPIKIKVHRYMKQGIAMAIPVADANRVGSTDITFRAPGSKNEWFYRELDTQMGCQVRCYSDQGVIHEKPYHCTLFTSISSTSDVLPS